MAFWLPVRGGLRSIWACLYRQSPPSLLLPQVEILRCCLGSATVSSQYDKKLCAAYTHEGTKVCVAAFRVLCSVSLKRKREKQVLCAGLVSRASASGCLPLSLCVITDLHCSHSYTETDVYLNCSPVFYTIVHFFSHALAQSNENHDYQNNMKYSNL